jgi:hypothetical protein
MMNMKNNIIILLGLMLGFLTASCSSELGNELTFDVELNAADLTKSGDTIVIKKSREVRAVFSGNAEFISYYNGETGKNYATSKQVAFPAGTVETKLKFTATPQYGTIPGTLRVFVSDSFNGLVINDKKADSVLIKNTAWTEITDQCNLSTVSNVAAVSEVSLNAYQDKKIALAFYYKTTDNTVVQPTWIIRALEVINSNTKGISEKMAASQIGFVPFDMLSNTNAYLRTGGAGVWDLRNITSASDPLMRINTSAVDAVLNEDWLISLPFVPNTRTNPDRGTPILDLGRGMEDYVFSFAQKGVYEIAFVGIRHNYLGRSEIAHSFIVKIID